MAVEVKMPKLGLTMEEGRIVKWTKNIGERVEKDEVIAIIETEKLTGEVKSPTTGFLAKKLVREGDIVKVGEIIAVIAESEDELKRLLRKEKETFETIRGEKIIEKVGEDTKSRAEGKTRRVKTRVRASPAARALAKRHSIRLEEVKGTGPGGLITYSDVVNYIQSVQRQVEETITEAPVTRVPKIIEERELSPMRLRIAENLAKSSREMVLTTITMEACVDEIVYLRSKLPKDKRPSITAFLVKALAQALREYREFNARLEDNKLRIYGDINIGVAVALENGLIVPVIRNADEKTLTQINNELKELAKKARENKLTVDDLTGATITLSNLGMYDVDVFTPIVYPGHIAVLGVGRIYDKLVLEENHVKTRKYVMLSLTFDHRAVDGAQAALFLKKIREYIENPYLILF